MAGFRIALIMSISLSLGGAAFAQAVFSAPPPVRKREEAKTEAVSTTAPTAPTALAVPKAKQKRKCRRDNTIASDGPLGRMVCEGDAPKDGPDAEAAQRFLHERQTVQR